MTPPSGRCCSSRCCRRTGSGRAPSSPSRLGVSARTLRRDVDRLRALGYPVDATPGRLRRLPPRGRRAPPAARARRRRGRRHRGRAARRPPARRSTAWRTPRSRALAKLEQVLPDRLRRRVHAVHSNVVSLQWGGAPDRRRRGARRARARVSRPRAGPLRLPPPRRRRDRAAWSSPTSSCRPGDGGTSWRGTSAATTGARSGSTGSSAPRLAGVRCAARAAPRWRRGRVRRRVDPHHADAVLRGARRRRPRRRGARRAPLERRRGRGARRRRVHVSASGAGAPTRCSASSPCSRDRSRSSCANPTSSPARVDQLVARLRR